MQKKMHQAVLEGNPEVNYWCRISWKNHLLPYLTNSKIHIIQYESLLKHPVDECEKILKYIGLEREQKEISEAIKRQSFEEIKNKFNKDKEYRKVRFLRKGESKQWKINFSKREKAMYLKELSRELKMLGYEIS